MDQKVPLVPAQFHFFTNPIVVPGLLMTLYSSEKMQLTDLVLFSKLQEILGFLMNILMMQCGNKDLKIILM